MAKIVKHETTVSRDYLAESVMNTDDSVELDIKGYPITADQRAKGICAKVGVKTPYHEEHVLTLQSLSCSDPAYNGFQLNIMSCSFNGKNVNRPWPLKMDYSLLKDLHQFIVSDNDMLKECSDFASIGTLAQKEYWEGRKASDKAKTEAAALLDAAMTADKLVTAGAVSENTSVV